jgi:hypothetical protein
MPAATESLQAFGHGRPRNREMGMLLSIKTESNSITVIEKRVKPAEKA